VNWTLRWFRAQVRLDESNQERVAAWQALPDADLRASLCDTRWVVVDTETTGLDPRSDSLLSIGACRIDGSRLDVATSYYTLIRPPEVSSVANVLIHGIGHAEQMGGADIAGALAGCLEFCRRDVLVAYHAPFDEAMLRIAMQRHLGLRFRPVWLDAAKLADVLFPKQGRQFRLLDEWLAHFGVAHPARHNALADALCTAELLLILLAAARDRGLSCARQLIKAERSHQWLKA
jgi:DNA polymerase-3 subunit epsilon